MARRDSKGNPIRGEGRHIMVFHHMLDTEAGQSLSPQELAVLIRVMQIHNGENNQRIAMSVRRAAQVANVSKNTASKALGSLCQKGFLRIVTPSSFGTNGRRAVEYEITCYPPRKGKPAKNSFQHWRRPPQENTSSQSKDKNVPE